MYTEIVKPQNIKQLEVRFNVSSLEKYVRLLDEHYWVENKHRQSTYLPHADTESIGILWVSNETEAIDVVTLSTLQIKHPVLYTNVVKKIEKILIYLTNIYAGHVYKILLARLKAKKCIPLHFDEKFSLEQTHRVHIPIITNKLVKFTVGQKTLNMKKGRVYEINNCASHSVFNDGNEDRVHLIIDIIECKTLKEIRLSTESKQYC